MANRKQWTDDMIAARIMENYNATGKMPTVSYLRDSGQNDLSVQITRNGGFKHWAERLGLKREPSDSDTGWDGEIEVENLLKSNGYKVQRSLAVKWPFDLLVDGMLRIDVKAARYAEYGPCRGWFYRIGKAPQADLIALYQLDTKEVYWIPWVHVPQSNITISRDGGIYAPFRGNIGVVHAMTLTRKNEWRWMEREILKRAA